MNRKHSVEDYAHIVDMIREKIPRATLFTDIIVGFTGEEEEHFEHTRSAMHRFSFNMVYIAAYSQRPGAVSARWKDTVPQKIKKERLHRLTHDLEEVALSHTQKMVGTRVPVLVTGTDRKAGYLSAMTEGRIIVRFPAVDTSLIGTFTEVYITQATPFSVEGEQVTVAEPQSL